MQPEIVKNSMFTKFFLFDLKCVSSKIWRKIKELDVRKVRSLEILKIWQFQENWISHATENCANVSFQLNSDTNLNSDVKFGLSTWIRFWIMHSHVKIMKFLKNSISHQNSEKRIWFCMQAKIVQMRRFTTNRMRNWILRSDLDSAPKSDF